MWNVWEVCLDAMGMKSGDGKCRVLILKYDAVLNKSKAVRFA